MYNFWIKKKIFNFSVFIVLSCLAWIRTDGFRSFAISFSKPKAFNKISNQNFSKIEKQAVKYSRFNQVNISETTNGKLPEHIKCILSQKFYYLGRGRQVFVFVSEDGRYVAKFFNFHHFYYPFFFKKLPFLKDKSYRLPRACQSYQLAFEKLQEDTALLYLHFPQNVKKIDNLKRAQKNNIIQIINPNRVLINVDLDKTYFILQKKAEPFFSHLQFLAKQGKIKMGIDAFLETVVHRLQMNIVDDDLEIAKNYGFIGEKVVNFDAGRLSFLTIDPKFLKKKLSQKELLQKELFKSTKKLLVWLKQNYPNEAEYLKNRLALLGDQGF